jgi:heme-degrading monooxygenase HmoA
MDELMGRVDEGFAEQISRQPGFRSYEALDCDDGEVVTISVFGQAEQAEASRELAQRWSDEKLGDLSFTRLDALRGEILVSRAVREMLEPMHADTPGEFCSIRRYRLRSGSVAELMHIVDAKFADGIGELPGFVAYHTLDVGGDEVLSISVFAEQAQAEESDELALEFVERELGGFDIERTDIIAGRVVVSRAMSDVLEPAHA